MQSDSTINIDGKTLSIAAVHQVAVRGRKAVLSEDARQRMLATRSVIQGIVERNDVVYGVTTGFGKLSEVAIPPERLAQLQINLIRSHAAGWDRCFPRAKCAP
jgi:histidine ammonia-lyase